MPRIIIGTLPVQLTWGNPKRKSWELQFIPSSIEAGNTGKIYFKRGSAPKADAASNTWDGVLNAGASVGDNTDKIAKEAEFKGSIWAISDTADQVCTFDEQTFSEELKA